MTEFELIKQYFATQTLQRADVVHGIGDDAAVVKIPAQHELVITTDTLIESVHFPEETLPYDVGYKALAVNLSDLAAVGAMPAWVTLAITLPNADENWIQEFCNGFFTLANRYKVQLIGGDLTRGTLSVTVQALGLVSPGRTVLRSGANLGDLIYVTGTLGDAGLGLAYLQNKVTLDAIYERSILERLNRPEPRVTVGEELSQFATAAIDISDGLSADLNHILEQSQVGATVYVDRIPLSDALTRTLPGDKALALALTAGDDYELCFTVPPEKQALLEAKLSHLSYRYTCIGEITATNGLNLCHQNGKKYHGPSTGYQHF